MASFARNLALLTPVVTFLAASDAQAAPSEDDGGSASVSLSSEDGAEASGSADADKRTDTPWIRRWAPERNMWELGVYGGLFLPGANHELFRFDAAAPELGFKKFKTLAPELGGRIGYYPLRFLGVELEGGGMFASTTDDQAATLYTVRGHVLAQIPRWSVTPFLLAGAGALGVSSSNDAVGNDVDAAVHIGGGVKIYFNRWVAMRLDLRDVIGSRRGVSEGENHNFEALLGLSLTLGRKKAAPPPKEGPKDTDGDGIMDPDDKCVETPGVPEYEGCPIPDTDGDGFLDPDDKCPTVPGIAPDGCPDNDRDKDGIVNEEDKCPDDPETKNGFEDEDGCPDELPEEVKAFSGVIEGIYFDLNKDTIKPKSRPKLNQAADVLTRFQDIKIEVSGHTDNQGKHAYNMDLSARRAESVRNYLIGKGIDPTRITTKGYGPDQPRDTNKTKAGRANNRRIEFKILE
jgi:outer membrane protein OmpA-like peptidoglycan-associated protein